MKTLRLRIESPPVVTRTLRFTRFPVRIGRGSGCECTLDVAFVSRLHAQLDVRDGRLVLRDEGSRAGTLRFKDMKPLPAMEFVDVEDMGSEFVIGTLRFRADLVEDVPSGRNAPVAEEFETLDSSELHSEESGSATVHYGDMLIDPRALDVDALRRSLPPTPLTAEAMALRALRELSSFYVPYAPPLTSPEAVAEFTERLDEALAVMVEGVVSLRFAYLCETDFEPPSDPQQRDLGARLLDWTTDRSALDTLRAELTDMVGHHRRVISEAMAETRSRSRGLGSALVSVAKALGLLGKGGASRTTRPRMRLAPS